MKKQRFEIRACIIGSGLWGCPDCGHSHKLYLTPKARWRVKCKTKGCGSVFRLGLIFYRLGNGQGRTGRPPDTVIGSSIPESFLAPEPYKRGAPVHKVGELEVGAEEPKLPSTQAAMGRG